jgi:hypothetical protein
MLVESSVDWLTGSRLLQADWSVLLAPVALEVVGAG